MNQIFESHEAANLRLQKHKTVSKTLSEFNDNDLQLALNRTEMLGQGIGGNTKLISIEDTLTFVKIIPICEIERTQDNYRSTANIFQLPLMYQYGIGPGSVGFGAWRELEAQLIASGLVVNRKSPSFPLMYHWRVSSWNPASYNYLISKDDVSEMVLYWDNSKAVHERLDALDHATASLVLFSEYIPHNLNTWLNEQVILGNDAVDSAVAMVEAELESTICDMNSNGLLHFDLHFENILTDGRHLYFSDFGLALSTSFELTDEERIFYNAHANYDKCRAMTQLVYWIIDNLCKPTVDRNTFLQECVNGESVTGKSRVIDLILEKYAAIALTMCDFNQKLDKDKNTLFPDKKIEKLFSDLHTKN